MSNPKRLGRTIWGSLACLLARVAGFCTWGIVLLLLMVVAPLFVICLLLLQTLVPMTNPVCDDFPRTLAQLAGMMWNHSPKMWKGIEEKGIERPTLSPQEMADLVAYLFSTQDFDEPGDTERGKNVFTKKQCNLCHAKGTKMPNLSGLKGQISPIFIAQTMWNHGPEMLEKMRKAKVPWRKIDGKEMADLMEYLNRGIP